MKNYYQTLGLNSDASHQEIRQSYRTYASKFHPDKHKGDEFFEEKFKEIQEAHDVLSDPEQRRVYDLLLFPPKVESQSAPKAKENIIKSPPFFTNTVKQMPVKPPSSNTFVKAIVSGIAGGLLVGVIFEAASFGDGFAAGFLCGFFLGCCLGPAVSEMM